MQGLLFLGRVSLKARRIQSALRDSLLGVGATKATCAVLRNGGTAQVCY